MVSDRREQSAVNGRTGHASAVVRWPRPALVLAMVIAVVGGGLAASSLLRPSAVAVAEVSGDAVPVSSATLVCPDASVLGAASVTSVTAVSPLLPAMPPADGQPVTVAPLGDAAPLASVGSRGPVATATVEADEVTPVAALATGTLAPGLAATQLTTAAEGEVTGLAAARCGPPVTEARFAGLGTEVGHRPRLVLANVDEVAAEVDVALHGADGPIEAPTLQAVVVPAAGTATVELDAVAPDQPQLAVVVRATAGRVTAGVRDTWVDGLESLGFDWVPPSASPATRVVVPGVSGGSGPRLLQVLAPGELDTRVGLRLLTPTGAITPTGFEEIEVTAGSVHSVDLAEVTGAEVSAVELTSDEPVVAAVRVATITAGAPQVAAPAEMAYTSGTPALDGPAVATDVRAGDGWTGRLVLTAADDGGSSARTPALGTSADAADATVRLSYVDAATGVEALAQTIDVPAGSTLDVELAAPGGPERFALVVTPTRGVVYAAVQLARSGGGDAGFTIVPLTSPPLETDVPLVRHDLATGLRPTG